MSRSSSSGMGTFLTMWSGQVVSLLGSGLTSFALGVWVYETTGSATDYALILLFMSLPGILLSPVAGVLADRWDRRFALMVSDIGAGISSLAMAGLYLTGHLEVWHIYALTAVSSAFATLRQPAMSAAVSTLVPKEQFGRSSGLVQTGRSVAQIAAPLLAAFLVKLIGVGGVLLIDVVSFLFAVSTLLLIHIPPLESANPGARRPFWRDAREGWDYLVARPGLMGMLVQLACANYMASLVQTVITPFVLTFSDAKGLSAVTAVGGVGMLVTSLLLSFWGGPRRRILAVMVAGALEGLLLLSAYFRPTVFGVAVVGALFLACIIVIIVCNQAIWQSKVDLAVQGRVFALRGMIGQVSAPIAYVTAGPLVDRLFEPALLPGGALASSVGQFIGVGPGRGTALLYMVSGVLLAAVSLSSLFYPRIRRVESELPDIVRPQPQNPPVPSAQAVPAK